MGALRERRGLPLSKVCSTAGVSRDELRSIEAGEGRPSVHALARISEALGTTLLDLVRGAGTATPSGPALTVAQVGRALAELPAASGSKVDVVVSAAVLHAMVVTNDNQSAAARLLGMERKAFVRRLAKARRKR